MGRQALRAQWNLIDESGRYLTVAEYPVNRVLASGDTLTGLVIGIVDQLQPEPTWLLIHAYPQVDASGERQVIVTFVDVSDKQRIPFRQIVDLANDAVVVTEARPLGTPGPRIVYVNQSFTKLTGYAPEEVIGRTPRIFQGENTDLATQARIRAALAGNQSLRESLLNYRRNGSTYWIDLNINPLFDHNGQVKYFVAIERDVTSLMEESIGLRNAAATDALTGLLNRRGFTEQFQRLRRIASPQNFICCAISVDIDHFKRINDSEGHPAGDTVLRMLAQQMLSAFRRDDICARFGGEEFNIILPGLHPDEAYTIAERFRKAIESSLFTPAGKSVTISLGLASWQSADTMNSVLERSDAALYLAKQQGRNQTVADG